MCDLFCDLLSGIALPRRTVFMLGGGGGCCRFLKRLTQLFTYGQGLSPDSCIVGKRTFYWQISFALFLQCVQWPFKALNQLGWFLLNAELRNQKFGIDFAGYKYRLRGKVLVDSDRQLIVVFFSIRMNEPSCCLAIRIYFVFSLEISVYWEVGISHLIFTGMWMRFQTLDICVWNIILIFSSVHADWL